MLYEVITNDQQLLPARPIVYSRQLSAVLGQFFQLQVDQAPACFHFVPDLLKLIFVGLDNMLVSDDGCVGDKKTRALPPGRLNGHGPLFCPSYNFV